MATLKICVHDRTYWLMDVSEVRQLSSFDIPDESMDDSEAIIVAARKNGLNWPNGYTFTDFKGSAKPVIGNVICVDSKSGIEWWIVPNRSCFLMSDTGATIDRI